VKYQQIKSLIITSIYIAMSISATNIEKLLYQHFFNLDENKILEINKRNESENINNVINNLSKDCFGVWLVNHKEEVTYQLFYIQKRKKLEGCYIELSLNTKYKSHLIFFFSNFLAHIHNDFDPIDIYNNFQNETKKMLEKIGYLTTSITELENYEDPVLLSSGVCGIIKMQFLEKIKIYRELFHRSQLTGITPESDYIYLIMDKRNDYIKISKSKSPGFKKEVLKVNGSDLELITFWRAPPQKETQLHRLFQKNRKKGDWFKLKFEDLKTIKRYMHEYEK
jgi:hypothetical protein